MHDQEEIPENYHSFALFDPPPKGQFNDPCQIKVEHVQQKMKPSPVLQAKKYTAYGSILYHFGCMKVIKYMQMKKLR